MRTQLHGTFNDYHTTHESFVPSPLRERQELRDTPPRELEAAWGSSPLENHASPGRTTHFTSAYGPGPHGRLREPEEAVRAMARGFVPQDAPAEAPRSPDSNALGLANLPELRHVNLPGVNAAVHVSASYGLGVQNIPAGAQTVQADRRRQSLPEPEVEFRSWGAHRRQRAEGGIRIAPPTEQHVLQRGVASVPRFRPEDFPLTLDDLDGQFSHEFIPIHDTLGTTTRPRHAYAEVSQAAAHAANSSSRREVATPRMAPPTPHLDSGEWL